MKSDKKFFVKKRYLDLILEGKKTYEGSVGYASIRNVHKNDIVSIQRVKFLVEDVLIFKNYSEAFEKIDYKEIMPEVKSKEKAIKEMKKIYTLFKQEKYGVYIFKFKKVEDNDL